MKLRQCWLIVILGLVAGLVGGAVSGWIFFMVDSKGAVSADIEIIKLFVQGASLIALVVYVIKTVHIASAARKSINVSEATLAEMKEAHDQEHSPRIVVYFRILTDQDNPKRQEVLLIVKNFGKSIATNIKLDFSTPINDRFGDNVQDMSFVKNGIEMMIPGQEIETVLDKLSSYFKNGSNKPLTYDVTVSYHGELKRHYRTDKQILDLSVFKGLKYSDINP